MLNLFIRRRRLFHTHFYRTCVVPTRKKFDQIHFLYARGLVLVWAGVLALKILIQIRMGTQRILQTVIQTSRQTNNIIVHHWFFGCTPGSAAAATGSFTPIKILNT